jgi:hypothetical protein
VRSVRDLDHSAYWCFIALYLAKGFAHEPQTLVAINRHGDDRRFVDGYPGRRLDYGFLTRQSASEADSLVSIRPPRLAPNKPLMFDTSS